MLKCDGTLYFVVQVVEPSPRLPPVSSVGNVFEGEGSSLPISFQNHPKSEIYNPKSPSAFSVHHSSFRSAFPQRLNPQDDAVGVLKEEGVAADAVGMLVCVEAGAEQLPRAAR